MTSLQAEDIPIGGGRRQTVALMGAVGFGALGVALAVSPGVDVVGRAIGVFTAAFFGLLGPWAAARAHRHPHLYVLGDDGIRFVAWDYPSIPWSQVAGVRIVSSAGQQFLAVDVVDPEAVLAARGGRGRRLLGMNLRRGWGFLAIPAMQAPRPLEELGAEINRRRTGRATPVAPPVPARGPRILAAIGRPEVIIGLHGFTDLTRVAAVHGSRAVLLGVFAALLSSGAALVHYWPKLGVPFVVAVEAVIVALNLTLGHAAVSMRLLGLFFPMCVLMVLGSRPPRRAP